MLSFFFELKKRYKFLIIFLTIVVLSFFIQTILKGLQNSCDRCGNQQSFWDGVNHYEYQLKTKDIYLGCQKDNMVTFYLFYCIRFHCLNGNKQKLFG